MSSDRKNTLSDEEVGCVAGGAGGGLIKMNGTVTEQLNNDRYKVLLEDGNIATAHRSGQLRMNYVRILVGDQVTVEIRAEDYSNAKITYRFKK